ncbi:FxsA family protein [Bradyrhizobium sp. CCGB12]|uniref:FxsA family protein n=1 Tax=Bradyrhizobium sp. CCGB12 TaxID=2949632 RepID=UPI0020B2C521|nr:FxsA family protein [Bradyrhizobium sp. CCGB12]MCP3393624.1 FxsA family protein [Bradyrhizobium sp. CCGB12]
MSDAKPPLPKERWKGPPEGVPDYVGLSGNAGCSASSLLIVGSLLILAGLWPLTRALIALNWTIGRTFWLFLSGLIVGGAGITLVRIAKRRRSSPKQAAAPEAPQSPSGRDGCLTLFMALAGIVLLLPGLCSFVFGFLMLGPPPSGPERDLFDYAGYATMFLIGCVTGSTGGGMIWWTIVRPPAAAGLMTLVGFALLVPGLYFVLYGASRIYWADHSRVTWLLMGLPVGLVFIGLALRVRDQNAPPNP